MAVRLCITVISLLLAGPTLVTESGTTTTSPASPASSGTTMSALTVCCQSNLVPDNCLTICSYDFQITTDTASILFSCTQYIGIALKCAKDGNTFTACCQANGVTGPCLYSCGPESAVNGCLTTSLTAMLTCFKSGQPDAINMTSSSSPAPTEISTLSTASMIALSIAALNSSVTSNMPTKMTSSTTDSNVSVARPTVQIGSGTSTSALNTGSTLRITSGTFTPTLLNNSASSPSSAGPTLLVGAATSTMSLMNTSGSTTQVSSPMLTPTSMTSSKVSTVLGSSASGTHIPIVSTSTMITTINTTVAMTAAALSTPRATTTNIPTTTTTTKPTQLTSVTRQPSTLPTSTTPSTSLPKTSLTPTTTTTKATTKPSTDDTSTTTSRTTSVTRMTLTTPKTTTGKAAAQCNITILYNYCMPMYQNFNKLFSGRAYWNQTLMNNTCNNLTATSDCVLNTAGCTSADPATSTWLRDKSLYGYVCSSAGRSIFLSNLACFSRYGSQALFGSCAPSSVPSASAACVVYNYQIGCTQNATSSLPYCTADAGLFAATYEWLLLSRIVASIDPSCTLNLAAVPTTKSEATTLSSSKYDLQSLSMPSTMISSTIMSPPLSSTSSSSLSNTTSLGNQPSQSNKAVAIGVGVGIGLGVPLLLAVIALVIYCLRRQSKKRKEPTGEKVKKVDKPLRQKSAATAATPAAPAAASSSSTTTTTISSIPASWLDAGRDHATYASRILHGHAADRDTGEIGYQQDNNSLYSTDSRGSEFSLSKFEITEPSAAVGGAANVDHIDLYPSDNNREMNGRDAHTSVV